MLKKKLALSLDGGGARGLFSLNILMLLKKCIGVELCEVFSIAVGASVGALVGALVAFKILDEKFDVILDNVLQLGKTIFTGNKDLIKGLTKPLYSGKTKRSAIKKLFGDTYRLRDACIPFVVICTNINGTPHILKSWDPEDGNVLLLDALDASSAAPLYFPPVRINEEFLVDGGCTINNPTAVTMMLMREYYQSVQLNFKILSIGTHGVIRQTPITASESENMGLIDWIARDLVGLLMGSNDTSAVDISRSMLGAKNVLRIVCQVNTTLDTLDEPTISNLISETVKVWTEKEQDILDFILPADPMNTVSRTIQGECLAVKELLKNRSL